MRAYLPLLALAAMAPLQAQQEFGSVEGVVLNAITGEPIKKANLVLTRADVRSASQPYGAVSDAAGHFSIPNLAPGNYRLEATRTGFMREAVRARSGAAPRLIEVRGGSTENMVVRLTPQAVIAGRIVDEDGDPVMGASVQAQSYQYIDGRRRLAIIGSATTSDTGEYRLHSLPPRKYFLSVSYHPPSEWAQRAESNTPEERYATTFYPGAIEAAAAVPIEASPGSTLRGIDIALMKVRTVRVRGRVVNATTGTMVSLYNTEQQSYVASAPVGRDGTFEVRGVQAGSYLLTAQSFQKGTVMFGRQMIQVAGTNVDGVTLGIAPNLEVPGRIRVEGSSSVRLTDLRLSTTSEIPGALGEEQATPAEDGAFTLKKLVPWNWEIHVSGPLGDAYVKSARMGQQDVLVNGLDLTAGVAGPLEVVLGANGAQVQGSVADSDGKPLVGATVVLAPAVRRDRQTDLYRTVQTSQDGRFQLRGIAPGDYRLYAWAQVENGAWFDPEFLGPFDNLAEKLTLKEGDRSNVQVTALAVPSSPNAL